VLTINFSFWFGSFYTLTSNCVSRCGSDDSGAGGVAATACIEGIGLDAVLVVSLQPGTQSSARSWRHRWHCRHL